MPKPAVKLPVVVAIVGAEGSGKTVLTQQLKAFYAVPTAFEIGKAYCQKKYNGFYVNGQFLTTRNDFLAIATATLQAYQQAYKTALYEDARFVLLDTDLIYTDWFFQLQFPGDNLIRTRFFGHQRVDLYLYLSPARFVAHPLHYDQFAQKHHSALALQRNYRQFKPFHSKLITVYETDYNRRFWIVCAAIAAFLNETTR